MRDGYDPFKFGESVRKLVTREGPQGRERLYKPAPSSNPKNLNRDFRFSNYYLGTSVADVLGCNLRCVFCWAINAYRDYSRIRDMGKFFSPVEVATGLINTAKVFNCKYLRITEGEPTLDMDHLIHIMDNLKLSESPHTFILETNGLILGRDVESVKKLSQYANLGSKKEPKMHVRVSIKGATPQKFRLLTFADARFHRFQFDAIRNCLNEGISVHTAVMLDFIDSMEEIQYLKSSLASIDRNLLYTLEFERLFLEDYIVARLKKHSIPFKKILKEA